MSEWQAHPEDAEDIHLICDLLSQGYVSLHEESHTNTLAELVDAMIAGYNKLKGTDTHLSRKRLLSEKTLCYVNGFLLISVVA